MAEAAREATGTDELSVVADRGYFKSQQLLACQEAGISAYVPKMHTSPSRLTGRFSPRDFRYLPDYDAYLCPAGELLRWRMSSEEDGLNIHRYWTPACRDCALKVRCTTGPERRIRRWEHEQVLEAAERRLALAPQMMRTRRETVEHPFGTLKARMGATHFLTRGLKKVAAEMSLHVLAYNLTRVLNILGVQGLILNIRAMRA